MTSSHTSHLPLLATRLQQPPPAVLSSVCLGSSSPVTCVALSQSGRLLTACNDEKKMKIWETGNWTTLVERWAILCCECVYQVCIYLYLYDNIMCAYYI